MRRRLIAVWGEKRYLDLWTLNHTLSGCLLGAAAILVGMGFVTGTLLAALLAIAWEFFEHWRGVPERLPNRAWDVAVAVLGFALYWFLLRGAERPWALIAPTLAVWIFLQAWGLWALHRRGKNPFTNA